MIRFGISGCGGFLERGILPALQQVDNVKMLALYDPLKNQRVKNLCRKFGLTLADSFETMITADNIDAVYICSPNVFHKDQAIAAALTGKHVFCEKPLGLSADECRQMVDGCHASGVKLGVGFCYPFAGGQQKAKELIRQGAIGEVSYIQLCFNLGDYNKETVGWRCDPKMSGGGPLMDLAPHLVNLTCFFLEDKVESVMAYVRPELSKSEIELDVLAAMEFSRGARASLDTSFVRGNTHNYTIVGKEGQIHAVDTMNWQAGGKLTLQHNNHETDIPFEPVEGIAEEFRLFASAIESDECPPVPGEAGLHAQAVIDAIYESGRTGKRCLVNK